MKARFYVECVFDPAVTDAESLASALDILMETARSAPGILDDYGNPSVGKFWVCPEKPSPLGKGFYRCGRCQQGQRVVDDSPADADLLVVCSNCGGELKPIGDQQ